MPRNILDRNDMQEKIKYTGQPFGKVKGVKDFFPAPEELALKDGTVKGSISPGKSSIDFFKKEAKKFSTQYQKMIRRLSAECTARR